MMGRGEISFETKYDKLELEIAGIPVFADIDREVIVSPGSSVEFGIYPKIFLSTFPTVTRSLLP